MNKRRAISKKGSVGFKLSPFDISRRYAFQGSDLGVWTDPPELSSRRMLIQVFDGANYRKAYANDKGNLALNSNTSGTLNADYDVPTSLTVNNMFTQYQSFQLRAAQWHCEITNAGLYRLTSDNTAFPMVKNTNTADFYVSPSSGRQTMFPQAQSFGRPQGMGRSAAFPELDNGNDFVITIIGRPSSAYQNWGVCTEFNAGNVFTNDKILVGIGTTAAKLGATIRAGGVDYNLNFIDVPTIGDTHAVSLRVNGTTKEASLFLDGLLQDTVTFSNTYLNNAFCLFSRGGNMSKGTNTYQNWIGDFEEANIANRLLSNLEISDLHNALLSYPAY